MQDKGRFLAGMALAVGMVISAWLVATVINNMTNRGQEINVTGSAKRRIVSDRIEWQARVTFQSASMKEAYNNISNQTPRVVEYLKQQGIKPEEITVLSVDTATLNPIDKNGVPMHDKVSAYIMRQGIKVRSNDVQRVERIARASTELMNQGILLESFEPQYFYTKLGDLKIEMLAEAAKDAKLRAEQIANSMDARVGDLRSARMGVLQINPADSTATSGEGNNDTTSLEKDIIAVVSSSFALK